MDVLQKWNRSTPDGNGTAAAVLFFLLFIFLKQFYLFPSGGMEAADVCLFASFFMLLCDCMRRRPERLFQLKTEGLIHIMGFVLVVVNFLSILAFGSSMPVLSGVSAIWRNMAEKLF